MVYVLEPGITWVPLMQHGLCPRAPTTSGTENPPWVLVSLAVSFLQKNSIGCLFCFRPSSDASIASRSYWSCIHRCYFFFRKRFIAPKSRRPLTYFANRLKRHLSINFIYSKEGEKKWKTTYKQGETQKLADQLRWKGRVIGDDVHLLVHRSGHLPKKYQKKAQKDSETSHDLAHSSYSKHTNYQVLYDKHIPCRPGRKLKWTK
jgi:3'-phosphoadenosine 5'-phosphosulfate sulfotransferase (PAPS reductase)/FAD synthetase